MSKLEINWDKLPEIKELKDYFKDDFEGFKNKINYHLNELEKMTPEDLDNLAVLRALEVTNGCTQWAHRRGDKECLPIEKTRECMKLSMSSIKQKQIKLKNGEIINFSPEMKQLMDQGKELYINAFKNNLPSQEREFYAFSTAQFITCGIARMDNAFNVIKENYLDLFTDFFIDKGRKNVQPYLDAISLN